MNYNAIIISGPSSSGKTTLLRRKDFAQMLTNGLKLYNFDDNIFNKGNYFIITERKYKSILNQSNIIYHYDFLKNKTVLTKKYRFISDIFDNFKNITVVLCVCSANDLQNRYQFMENFRRKKRNLKKYINFDFLFKLFYIPFNYKNKERVFELYNDWLSFIKIHNPKILIYDSKNNLFLYDKNLSISSKIRYLINE